MYIYTHRRHLRQDREKRSPIYTAKFRMLKIHRNGSFVLQNVKGVLRADSRGPSGRAYTAHVPNFTMS